LFGFGKCFKRCFITEIADIIRYSPPICENNRNGGTVRITVNYKIRGIVFDKFEVIPDAKIMKIMEDGKILLRTANAAIMLMSNAKLQKYKVDQIVPVRVYDAKYIPYRKIITVRGIPFIPIKEQDREFDVNITDEDHKTLEPIYKRIDDEMAKFLKLDKKIQKAWKTLLDPSDFKPPAGFQEMDIKDVKGSGKIYRPEWSDIGSTTVYFKTEKASQIKNSVHVLRGYTNSILKHLTVANQLAETYESTDAAWADVYKQEK
jgi:hypothetical protein